MTPENQLYFPKSYDELLETKKKIKLGSNSVIITGIIEGDNDLFKEAKEKDKFANLELEQYFTQNYIYRGLDIYVKGFTKSAILQNDKHSLLQYTTIKNNILEENRKVALE